jgi:membrane-associated protein
MSHLIDVFLHLDMYLDTVIQQYGVWMYFILFVVVFLETGVVVTPFLPGDSLLFAAGALCARGDLVVGWLFLLLWLAAVLGDTVNYSIGHIVGPRAFHGQNRLFKREHLDRTHQFYERYGGKTIVLARFVPIIRTFAPFVAGIGRMSYGRFVTYNVLGGLLWTGLFVFGGYYFGNQPLVKRNFTFVILAIIVISLLPLVVELVQHYRRKARVARTQLPPEKVA